MTRILAASLGAAVTLAALVWLVQRWSGIFSPVNVVKIDTKGPWETS